MAGTSCPHGLMLLGGMCHCSSSTSKPAQAQLRRCVRGQVTKPGSIPGPDCSEHGLLRVYADTSVSYRWWDTEDKWAA